MAIEVIMPKVDMDQETGTLMEWCKSEGDQVKEGETLLVIETDKVAVDVEAPGSGRLAGISIGEGDTVPIGTVIAYLLAEEEELPVEAEDLWSAGQAKPPTWAAADKEPSATPLARNIAAAHGLDLEKVRRGRVGGRITKADVEGSLAGAQSLVADGKVYAAPAARRVAMEAGVDLTSVSGSGPAGRIQSRDVAKQLGRQGPLAAENTKFRGPSEAVPLVGIRRRIADRMAASYQAIPHIRFTARVDMTQFLKSREALNARAEKQGGTKVSVTAILVKLIATTLKRHPFLNSSLADDEILLHKRINIGIAVALEEGLIVPVIKDADSRDILQIGAEVDDLAQRSRQGRLQPAEVKGGTFTLSNLGPFGIEQFDAIINSPEAAILAVGATQVEAVPAEDGSLQARPMMRMTLSADHRIVDGAVAARFMADLKAVLEDSKLPA